MVHIDLRGDAAALPPTDRATARCGACGSTFEYQRHWALLCPYCAATFTHAYFSPVQPIRYIDFDAEGGAAGVAAAL